MGLLEYATSQDFHKRSPIVPVLFGAAGTSGPKSATHASCSQQWKAKPFLLERISASCAPVRLARATFEPEVAHLPETESEQGRQISTRPLLQNHERPEVLGHRQGGSFHLRTIFGLFQGEAPESQPVWCRQIWAASDHWG